jgi:hypothetical protein
MAFDLISLLVDFLFGLLFVLLLLDLLQIIDILGWRALLARVLGFELVATAAAVAFMAVVRNVSWYKGLFL